jgi:predicted dehydrogenase
VHVCTPVATHRELCLAAIEARVPVLTEKPATVTVDEIDEIIEASERTGVPVSVVHNHLFSVSVGDVRDRMEAGELGDIRGVDVIATGDPRPDEPNRGSWTFELAGGEFEEGIPHQLYVALALGGYPADRDAITATTALYGDYEQGFSYDGLQIQWVSDDQALCSAKLLSGGQRQRLLLVHGEEASLVVDLLAQTTVKLDRAYAASPLTRAMSNVDHVLDRVGGTARNAGAMAKRRLTDDPEVERRWNSLASQFEAEARALLADEPPAVPIEEARWTVTLMEVVREAAGERATPAAVAGTGAEEGE